MYTNLGPQEAANGNTRGYNWATGHLQATGELQLDPPKELEHMRGGFFCDEPVGLLLQAGPKLIESACSDHLQSSFASLRAGCGAQRRPGF